MQAALLFDFIFYNYNFLFAKKKLIIFYHQVIKGELEFQSYLLFSATIVPFQRVSGRAAKDYKANS